MASAAARADVAGAGAAAMWVAEAAVRNDGAGIWAGGAQGAGGSAVGAGGAGLRRALAAVRGELQLRLRQPGRAAASSVAAGTG
eukprot:scaffold114413_cov17-Tisochrysis_lutea.AAC.1